MGNERSQALGKWLNETFNDFYSVWSPSDCNQHIVHHDANTPHEAFEKMLKMLYPEDNFESGGFGIIGTEAFFVYTVERTIEISPFDSAIHHTNAI